MGKYNGMVYVYDEEDSLAHYGIMGQKWGLRRFQNEDRTLTPEGKERYRKKSEGTSSVSIKTASKDYMDFTYGKVKDKKRADLAAQTGLKALKKLGRDIPDDASDDDKKDWFLYEDQTVGLPVIADLINRGYTSKQVGNLIDEVNDRDWASYDDPKESDLVFNLGETTHNSVGKKFAQACDETILESFVSYDGEGPHSDTIVNRFEKMHGRGISHEEAKTKEGKKALDAFIIARDKEFDALREAVGLKNPKKLKEFDEKPWTFSGNHYMKNPDYKKAKEQYDEAWRNYCEQVLRDMEMPVNDKTVGYIEYLLNWYV